MIDVSFGVTQVFAFVPMVATSGGAMCMLFMFMPVAVYLLVLGYRSCSRQLLIKNVPTSDCGGVTPGLVELQAVVVADKSMPSPISDVDVVYVKYSIEEQVKTASDSTAWKEVSAGEELFPFYLQDESGRVRVEPGRAEIHSDKVVDGIIAQQWDSLYKKGPAQELPNSTHKRRFKEENIRVGQNVYVLGPARAHEKYAIPEISGAWNNSDPFLISTRDESYLISKYERRAHLQFVAGGAIATALPTLATMFADQVGFGEALQSAIVPTFVIGIAVSAFVWGIYRMQHHLHLVDLRKRMERSLSLLRGQYRAREALIAKITDAVGAVVEGPRKRKLRELFEHRTRPKTGRQGRLNRPGGLCAAINEQTHILDGVFSIAEASPELVADDSFYELLEQLTRCETKMMMARRFYNDGMWRLSEQPESFSGTGGPSTSGSAGAERALTFKPFERKPVDIELSEAPNVQPSTPRPRSAAKPPVVPSTGASSPEAQEARPEPPQQPPPVPAAETHEEPVRHEEPAQVDEFEEVAVADDEATPRERFGVTMDFEERDDVGVTMKFKERESTFGVTMKFGSSPGFGDLEGFGEARSFDEVRGKRKPRKYGSFGKSKERAHFGFSDSDRRSLFDPTD